MLSCWNQIEWINWSNLHGNIQKNLTGLYVFRINSKHTCVFPLQSADIMIPILIRILQEEGIIESFIFGIDVEIFIISY